MTEETLPIGWERPIVLAMFGMGILFITIGGGTLLGILTNPLYCGNCQWTEIPPFWDIFFSLFILSVGILIIILLLLNDWI
jgi:hypothetical protein